MISKYLMLCVLVSSLECVAAQDSPPIKFAGVWVRGNAIDAEKSCPIGFQYARSVKTELDDKAAVYMRDLHASLVKHAKVGGTRIIDHIAGLDYVPDASMGNAYVMACALKYEIIESGILPSGQQGTFSEIGFDLMICNFTDRSVITSIPCRLAIQDHGEKNQQNMIDVYEKHLPGVLAKLAEEDWNPGVHNKTIGITSVKILTPEEMDEVPDNMVGFPKEIMGKHHLIASHIAASRLYEKTNIPVQPYSGGEEAVFYGLREELVDVPILEKQRIEESGFVLKKTEYQMEIKGAYFSVRNGGFVNYICTHRMTIQNESGEEIVNHVDQASSDAIPFRQKHDNLLWHYQADATVRMFEIFANHIIQENKKNNIEIRKMWNDVSNARFHNKLN